MYVAAISLVLVALYGVATLAARRHWGRGHAYADVVTVGGAVGLGVALTRLLGRPSADIDLIMYTAMALAVACLLIGLLLFFRNHALPPDSPAARHSSMTNLAVSLMTGGGVALVLFALESAHADRAEDLQDREIAAQQRADFQLAVALAPDLSGFTPPRDGDSGRPLAGPYSMVGSYLNGKKLANATLADVDLRRANLNFTHIGGGRLRSANLQDARMRGAFLRYADLRCACLAGAVLDDADLSNTDLRGVDLRNASLRRVDLRGALTDEETLWPGPELQAGLCRTAADGSCGREARNSWKVDHSFALRTDVPAERGCTPLRVSQ